MKYLITVVLIYLAVRFFVRPRLGAGKAPTWDREAPKKAEKEGDYIDYEEVK
jgi:hypothetical protein